MATQQDELMTPKEAADYLKCSRSLIYQIVEEKRLPCIRIGGRGRRGKLILKKEDLDDFLRSCREEHEG